MVQTGRLNAQMNGLDERNPTVVSASRLVVYSLRYRVKYLYLPLLSALKGGFIPECLSIVLLVFIKTQSCQITQNS